MNSRYLKFIFVTYSLIHPALVAYLLMLSTKDAVCTISGLIVLGYMPMIHLYNNLVDSFRWEWYIHLEKQKNKGKLFVSLALLFLCTALSAVLLYMFSELSPSTYSLKKLTLPVPFLKTAAHYVYTGVLGFMFVVLMPISEELYYRIFQLQIWQGIVGHLFVSWSIGLVYLSIMIQIAKGTEVILFSTIGVCVIQFLLVGLNRCIGSLASMFARIGLGLGMFAWLCFLVMCFEDGQIFQQPEVLDIGERENIFS